MPRFDIYRNPNPRASHAFYLDVQSDLVSIATRWCIPLLAIKPGQAVVTRAQSLLTIQGIDYLVDTPNILAVPFALLRNAFDRAGPREQSMIDASIEFMLRGY